MSSIVGDDLIIVQGFSCPCRGFDGSAIIKILGGESDSKEFMTDREFLSHKFYCGICKGDVIVTWREIDE